MVVRPAQSVPNPAQNYATPPPKSAKTKQDPHEKVTDWAMVRGKGPRRPIMPSLAYFFMGEAVRLASKRPKNGRGPKRRQELDLLRHAGSRHTTLPRVPGAPTPQASRPGSLPKADGRWRLAAAEKATGRQPFLHMWVVDQKI